MKNTVLIILSILAVFLLYWFGIRQIYYFSAPDALKSSICECMGPEIAVYGERECVGIPKPCDTEFIERRLN